MIKMVSQPNMFTKNVDSLHVFHCMNFNQNQMFQKTLILVKSYAFSYRTVTVFSFKIPKNLNTNHDYKCISKAYIKTINHNKIDIGELIVKR